jgi:hypothetical protein
MRAWLWTFGGQVALFALVVPLALSSALPMFARALGRPVAHVCQCPMRDGHSTCDCPMCNQHNGDRGIVTIRETCDDDDVAFGASLGSALAPPPGIAVLAPDVTGMARARVVARLASVFRTPPTPPPRRARA